MVFSSMGDNGKGGWQKGTSKEDFVLACGVADRDTSFNPTGHTSLIQGEEVISAHYIQLVLAVAAAEFQSAPHLELCWPRMGPHRRARGWQV
jgi:hypothetical protein